MWGLRLPAVLTFAFTVYLGLALMQITPPFDFDELDALGGLAILAICGLFVVQVRLSLKDFRKG